MNLTVKDRAKIERVGYVVCLYDSDPISFKLDHIFKVKSTRIDSYRSCGLTILVECDSKGSTGNGHGADKFRLVTKKEGELYEMCGEPVHINQLDTYKGMSKGDQLINEAKVRGFVKGAKVIHLTDGSVRTIKNSQYRYYNKGDLLYVNTKLFGQSICIHKQGEWTKFSTQGFHYADDYNSQVSGRIYEQHQDGSLTEVTDWYKKVKKGDWIKCIDPTKISDDNDCVLDRGYAWVKNMELKVLWITKDTYKDGSDRYIFATDKQTGAGVVHTACVPTKYKKPNVKFSVEFMGERIGLPKSFSAIKSTVRGLHPGWMVVDDLNFQDVDDILPINIVRRRKRKVKIEILETNQIVELLIKKRRKRR